MKRRPRPPVILAGLVFLLLAAFPVFSADVKDLLFEGADLHYRGRVDEAIDTFREALRLDPENEFAHNQLGTLYAKKERFDEAFGEFSRVVEIDYRNTYAHLWLGYLYLQKNDLDRGFAKFREVISLDPANAEAYYFIGTIYNIRHNPVKAIEFLKKARDADSEEPETHYRLGLAFSSLDMVNNALLEYERTIALKPSHTNAMNDRGWILYNQGKKDEAIAQWREVMKVNPKDRDAPSNLAKVYGDTALRLHGEGKTEEAVQYWKKMLSVQPGNKAASYYLKKYK